MTDQQRKTEQKAKARAMEAALKRFAPAQMSFWHDEVRAIANELTRCALISCRAGGVPRRHFQNERLFTLGNSTVTYTGEELRGNDEDVFLTLVHLVREKKLGNLIVKVTSAEICRLNGWETRQIYYTEIFKSVQRLAATSLTIFSARIARMRRYEKARAAASEEELARLWDEIRRDDDDDVVEDGQLADGASGLILSMVGSKIKFSGATRVVDDIPHGNLEWEIPLEDEMVSLFAREWATLMPLPSRRKLSTGARRLQAYYMGHKEPYPVKVSTLAGLLQLGLPEKEGGAKEKKDVGIKENKRIVKKRLQELVDYKVLESFSLDAGLGDVLVHVKRGASIDQARLDIDATDPDKAAAPPENDPPEAGK